jgi:hypothetical protein
LNIIIADRIFRGEFVAVISRHDEVVDDLFSCPESVKRRRIDYGVLDE